MIPSQILKWWGALLLGIFAAHVAGAQVQFNTIFSFNGTDGVAPDYMFLTQGTDGNFYGTTMSGGTDLGGVIFKITPSGQETILYNFCQDKVGSTCRDGSVPYAGVIQASDGNFYGTTDAGGESGLGNVFKITPSGQFTSLYSFCALGPPCLDGNEPWAPLVQGNDGNLYGTTTQGGIYNPVGGTLFKITLDGALTTLHSFGSGDGTDPVTGLIQGPDGNYYGSVTDGGADDGGSIYMATADGVVTTIYNFCSLAGCTDGNGPESTLILGTDGNFYGTTEGGGTTRDGGQGTVFRITPSGQLTTLYRFCEHPTGRQGHCPDSGKPREGLALISNGYVAGTTEGAFDVTTIYGISQTRNGFQQYTRAGNTPAGLLQGTNGLIYGIGGGGTYGEGTIFSLGVGLPGFIRTTPVFGPTATPVVILGTNLTGTTSVTFNGMQANFNIVSASEITTSVPSGATSGRVKVTTPNGTLTSNLPFTVTQ